jgi:hypothetical protein
VVTGCELTKMSHKVLEEMKNGTAPKENGLAVA